MTVPFMRAYTELLVRTCHARGAHAIGGMSAFIPNSREPEVTARALEKVRADKSREAADGFDGSWVAHPGLIDVARAEFDAVLDGAANQLDRDRSDVEVTAAQLLDVRSLEKHVTDEGFAPTCPSRCATSRAGFGASARSRSTTSWRMRQRQRSRDHSSGSGSRRRPSRIQVPGSRGASSAHCSRGTQRRSRFEGDRFSAAAEILRRVALEDEFPTFLTIPAYAHHLCERPVAPRVEREAHLAAA